MIWLARALWLIVVLLAVVAVWLTADPRFVAPASGDQGFPALESLTLAIVGLGYATSGLLILHRRPRHIVGLLLVLAGLALAVLPVAFGIGLDMWTRRDLGAAWVLLLGTTSFWPALLIAGPGVALVYPNGRLPDRRWTWPVRVLTGAIVITLVIGVLGTRTVVEGGPANPLEVNALPGWLLEIAQLVGLAALVLLFLAGVVAILVRFRRSRGEERAQLKWLAFAVVLWSVILATSFISAIAGLFPFVIGSLVLVPAAIVIAITRYRLYEIDTLINRTVAYLVLIGIVAGLYAGLIVLLQRIFVVTTGNTSDAAAIISALILAALLHPIRKLVEGVVDRRFKPTSPTEETGVSASATWTDPGFEAAVERVVRRVMREERPPQ